MVQIPSFRHSNAVKFQKYFRTFYLQILGQRHGVIISVQPITGRSEVWREIYIFHTFLLFVFFFRLSVPKVLFTRARLTGKQAQIFFGACVICVRCFEGMRSDPLLHKRPIKKAGVDMFWRCAFGPCRSTHAFKTNNKICQLWPLILECIPKLLEFYRFLFTKSNFLLISSSLNRVMVYIKIWGELGFVH